LEKLSAMKKLAFLLIGIFLLGATFAQKQAVRSGPMLGYTEMREVMIWIQTHKSEKVKIGYWSKNAVKPVVTFSNEVITSEDKAFTAKLICRDLEPGKVYYYNVFINGRRYDTGDMNFFHTQSLWQYRTDPPDFSMATGSCAYVNEEKYDRPNKPYGGEYQIFQSIAREKPNFMLWLGDNTYLREVDFYSRYGMMHRYSHTREIPELADLLRYTHHYAIWDDHDYGPNDADRSFVHKERALEAFELFWPNPSFGINGKPGTTSFFSYADIDFFLLDNRYYRSPQYQDPNKRFILGDEQIEWLIDALKYSKAPFKMIAVGGQFLNSAAVYENHAVFPAEKEKIIQRLKEEKIKGVVWLSGDRHHSEVSRYKDVDGFLMYDITVSPLTSSPATNVNEINNYRIPESLFNKRMFAHLHFSGKRKNRVLKLEFKDAQGEIFYNFQIEETEWK
jgi:alkaline phosphatase D